MKEHLLNKDENIVAKGEIANFIRPYNYSNSFIEYYNMVILLSTAT